MRKSGKNGEIFLSKLLTEIYFILEAYNLDSCCYKRSSIFEATVDEMNGTSASDLWFK